MPHSGSQTPPPRHTWTRLSMGTRIWITSAWSSGKRAGLYAALTSFKVNSCATINHAHLSHSKHTHTKKELIIILLLFCHQMMKMMTKKTQKQVLMTPKQPRRVQEVARLPPSRPQTLSRQTPPKVQLRAPPPASRQPSAEPQVGVQ